jgi:hypothetical protein
MVFSLTRPEIIETELLNIWYQHELSVLRQTIALRDEEIAELEHRGEALKLELAAAKLALSLQPRIFPPPVSVPGLPPFQSRDDLLPSMLGELEELKALLLEKDAAIAAGKARIRELEDRNAAPAPNSSISGVAPSQDP